ncbi:MAG TPA: lysophospholipid acyltransferase family protein [Actinomycetota bacterium]|nr:lysophospholipid acyltransferase family protein [Actinomycetota bacterium]
MFWFLMKHVLLGPLLRLLYRPRVRGLEHVPREGGAILAANHLSFLDDLLLPLVVPRKVVFLAKAEYFDRWYLRWFFKGANVIPVRRASRSAAEDALRTAVRALRQGQLVGIFPEGTRSPDGRLYRGRTGVARMALEARVPVVPVGIVGTFEALPYDRKVPRPRRVEIRFGWPLSFERFWGRADDRFALRSATDEVMYEIMRLTGQEYVDEYASSVKERLAAASGAEGGPAPPPSASKEGPAPPSSEAPGGSGPREAPVQGESPQVTA